MIARGVRVAISIMDIYTLPSGGASSGYLADMSSRAERGILPACSRTLPAPRPRLPPRPAEGYLSSLPGIDTIIPRFKAADRTTRLETLLDYSRKLPPLPERLELEKARGDHRVHECQTPVFLWVEIEDGQVHIHADVPRESPTVRGFVSLLARSLDGAPPEDVAKVPDDLLDQLGLSETLGMTRTQGLTAILHRIKRTVAAA
jgi:cysteine desulfuration protein SufE